VPPFNTSAPVVEARPPEWCGAGKIGQREVLTCSARTDSRLANWRLADVPHTQLAREPRRHGADGGQHRRLRHRAGGTATTIAAANAVSSLCRAHNDPRGYKRESEGRAATGSREMTLQVIGQGTMWP